MERTVYLIKNKVRINDGLNVKNQSLVVPFTNMNVASSSTDANQKITLVTSELMEQTLKNSIASSQRTYVGQINLGDYSEIDEQLTLFNGGHSIAIIALQEDGSTANRQYGKAGSGADIISKPGDIIEVKLSSITARNEELIVSTLNVLEQLTYNNNDLGAFISIGDEIDTLKVSLADVPVLRTDVNTLRNDVNTLSSDKANKLEVYSKSETYTKAQIDASQSAQDTKINANTQAITTNKAAFDSLKAQADIDHFDIAQIHTQLNTTQSTANHALSLGTDWNTEKINLVRREELTINSTYQLNARPFVRVGTTGDIYEVTFNSVYDGQQPLDFSTIVGHPKAVLVMSRTLPSSTVIRVNEVSDPKWNDTSAEGSDTIYLATTLSTEDKVAHVASVKIEPSKATIVFPNGLAAGERDVFLQYKANILLFEDNGATSGTAIGAADEVARQQAAQALTVAAEAKSSVATVAQSVSALATKVDTNGALILSVESAKADGTLQAVLGNGTAVNISTMDGTTDDKKLATKAYADTKASTATMMGQLALKADATALAAKQDELTKVIELSADDGTTIDIKVG